MLKWHIDERREEMGLSKAALAEKTGIPYSRILRLCRGECKTVYYSDLEALSRVLECTINDLMWSEEA